MKYKFKMLWEQWRDYMDIVLGIMALIFLFSVIFWANENAKKNNPMDSTSEEGIRAKSFEYNGHQYILL